MDDLYGSDIIGYEYSHFASSDGLDSTVKVPAVLPFKHDPLPDTSRCIRLLNILPYYNPAEPDVLRAQLTTWQLTQAPEYSPISYTWGGLSDPQRTLYIDGRPFPIYKNCFVALWQCQFHFPGRPVWIDAVCIDQAELQEKNHQVAMMMSIYQQGLSVLVSLGTSADDSNFLLDYISNLEDHLQEREEQGAARFDIPQPLAENIERLRVALIAFYERAYWRRLWIVQEWYAGGREQVIMCGRKKISHRALSLIIAHQKTMTEMDRDHLIARFDTEKFWFGHDGARMQSPIGKGENSPEQSAAPLMQCVDRWKAYSIFGVLRHFRPHDRLCTDPRDRIFGLLGLVHWADGEPLIVPDYRESATSIAKRLAKLSRSPHDLQVAMKALRLSGEDHNLRALEHSQQMKNHRLGKNGRILGPQDADVVEWLLKGPPCVVLLRGSDGHLFACDARKYDWKLDLHSLSALLINVEEFFTRSTTGRDPPRNTTQAGLQKSHAKRESTRLFSSSGYPLGYVCHDAQPGDVMFHIDGYKDFGLIIRQQYRGHEWDIIGMGIASLPEENNFAWSKYFRVRLVVDDALVLSTRIPIFASDASPNIANELLHTCPVRFPKNAVKCSSVFPFADRLHPPGAQT